MRLKCVLLAALLVAWATAPAFAVSPAVVQHCKKATALLMTDDAEASAFCIDSSGMFLTNAHAVEGLKPGDRVKLVLSPGEKEQRVLSGDVLRVDAGKDLALVRALAPGPFEALTFGGTDGLYETQEVVAFGYPFGSDLAVRDGTYPSVSVSTGHITALRKENGDLQQIQLDASLNPGNSGGPVVKDEGQVIGIVQSGVPGAAINFAIPSSQAQPFLSAPVIFFAPPPVKPDEIAKPHDFTITVADLGRAKPVDTVELTLSEGSTPDRVYTAHSAGTFHIEALPADSQPAAGPLQLLLKDGATSLEATAADHAVQFNGRAILLSRVKQILLGTPTTLVFTDGRTEMGSLSGAGTASTLVGGQRVTVDLAHFRTVNVSTPGGGLQPISYRIVAKAGGTQVAEVGGFLPIEGITFPSTPGAAPEKGAGVAPPPHQLAVHEIKLPTKDIVYDAAEKRIYASVPSSAGASGNSVVSIDPVTGAIGRPIFVGSSPSQLAISNDGRLLYVALDGSHAIRVVDLLTHTAGMEIPLGGDATVEDMAVAPNNPVAIAVSIQHPGYSPHNLGVYLYVNGRKWSTSKGDGNTIAFSDDGSRLYGYDNEVSTWSFFRNVILPGGVLKLDSQKEIFEGYNVRMKEAAGRIYTTTGVVANPDTWSIVGTCEGVGWAASVCPDPQRGRVYYLFGNSVAGYDAAKFTPIGRADIKAIKGGASSLITCGPDELAFRTDSDQVFVLPTALVRPQAGPPPVAPNGDPAQDDGDLIPVIVLVPDDDGF